MPNVVICTENVVAHALPNLPKEKKEEEKRGGKEGKFAFFSLDKLGSAWVTTFSVPITTPRWAQVMVKLVKSTKQPKPVENHG